MIIFGTRGVTTTPEKGVFYCPTCNSKQHYGFKRVRRFFTLYFIPLIPLDKLGEYVECTICKDTYKPVVLDYDQDQDDQEFEAEYHNAIKKVMIHVLLADGIIDDSEVKTVSEIYQQITGRVIENQDLRVEIDFIQKTNENFSDCLLMFQGCLNEEGKELVIRAAYSVAMADGEFQEEEQVLINKIGSDLGMTEAHIRGVIAGV